MAKICPTRLYAQLVINTTDRPLSLGGAGCHGRGDSAYLGGGGGRRRRRRRRRAGCARTARVSSKRNPSGKGKRERGKVARETTSGSPLGEQGGKEGLSKRKGKGDSPPRQPMENLHMKGGHRTRPVPPGVVVAGRRPQSFCRFGAGRLALQRRRGAKPSDAAADAHRVPLLPRRRVALSFRHHGSGALRTPPPGSCG